MFLPLYKCMIFVIIYTDQRKTTNTQEVQSYDKGGIDERIWRITEAKKVHIDSIYQNDRKSTIENAIECLKCPDELLDKYLIVVTLKYENTGHTIANNGDFKHHPHNRLYVFNTARQILAD